MPSMEIKNWLTALIVGILGLVLAACGVVVAYKQLRGTKRVDDVEAAHPEDIAMHEGAVLAQGSESLRYVLVDLVLETLVDCVADNV